jgi:hypothetical protein
MASCGVKCAVTGDEWQGTRSGIVEVDDRFDVSKEASGPERRPLDIGRPDVTLRGDLASLEIYAPPAAG